KIRKICGRKLVRIRGSAGAKQFFHRIAEPEDVVVIEILNQQRAFEIRRETHCWGFSYFLGLSVLIVETLAGVVCPRDRSWIDAAYVDIGYGDGGRIELVFSPDLPVAESIDQIDR